MENQNNKKHHNPHKIEAKCETKHKKKSGKNEKLSKANNGKCIEMKISETKISTMKAKQ